MLDQDPVHLIVLVAEFGDVDANPQGKQKKNDTKIDIFETYFFWIVIYA